MNKGYVILPWLLFGFLLIIFLVFTSTKSGADDEAVVSFKGGEISKQQLHESMFQLVGPQEIDFLIFEQIIELEAKKENIEITPQEINDELDKIKNQAPSPEEFEMMLMQNGMSEEGLLDQIQIQLTLRKIFFDDFEITEEELKQQFEEQKDLYQKSEQIQASHILLDSEKDAKDILGRLKEGEDFAQVAMEHSNDFSGEQGGNLGYFGKGVMTPAFEEAAFALEVGVLSEVVETEDGFHIILVTDKVDEVVPSFDEVKDDVYDDVVDYRISIQLQEWVEQKKIEYEFKVKENF